MKDIGSIVLSLCTAALALALGCSSASPPGPVQEAGSKATQSPTPKALPEGVKVGSGTAVVQ